MIENTGLMSVRETARYLNIGINAVYALCKEPDFPSMKIGNRYCISKEKLDSVWIPNRLEHELKGV